MGEAYSLALGNDPYMYIGDFNELIIQEGKLGIRPHCQNKINLFRCFLDNAGLMDMALKGCRFTWFSNPRNGIITKEKIILNTSELIMKVGLPKCCCDSIPTHLFLP